MPTFDIVSRFDLQEVRNAVDQASREIVTRFDLRNTGSAIMLSEKAIKTITLTSSTKDRLIATRQVLEEKFAKRKVSIKTLEYGTIQSAAGDSYRLIATLKEGIPAADARELNKSISKLGIKGVQSSVQGDHLRVQSKNRDDLQAVITALKKSDFRIPLQYINFRNSQLTWTRALTE